MKLRRELNKRSTLLIGLSWNRLRETTDYGYFNIIADSTEIKQVTATSIEVNVFLKDRRNVVTNSVDYLGLSIGLMRKVTILHEEYRALFEVQVNRKMFSKYTTLDLHQRFTATGTQAFIKGGVEKTYSLNEKIKLTITPFFKHSLGSIYSSESVYSLRAVQIGLDIGFLLPLK
jgi:hypothetical protein